jgi:hypothetical protein
VPEDDVHTVYAIATGTTIAARPRTTSAAICTIFCNLSTITSGRLSEPRQSLSSTPDSIGPWALNASARSPSPLMRAEGLRHRCWRRRIRDRLTPALLTTLATTISFRGRAITCKIARWLMQPAAACVMRACGCRSKPMTWPLMVRKVFTDRVQFQTAPTNLRPGSLFTWSAVIPAVFSACV